MSLLPLTPFSRRKFIGQAAVGALALSTGAGLRANELLGGKRKLGVALVGLGSYSRGQLGPALRKTELCELRGVVTGDAEKGRRWAQSYGFSPDSVYSYETMAGIAQDPNIDIVYVVTPPGLHKRDVLVAAAAGKHVICEKPMAVSVDECDAMIAACDAAKVRLSIGYRLHFHAYHQRVKQLAATGGVGWAGADEWRIRLSGFGQILASEQSPGWWGATDERGGLCDSIRPDGDGRSHAGGDHGL